MHTDAYACMVDSYDYILMHTDACESIRMHTSYNIIYDIFLADPLRGAVRSSCFKCDSFLCCTDLRYLLFVCVVRLGPNALTKTTVMNKQFQVFCEKVHLP